MFDEYPQFADNGWIIGATAYNHHNPEELEFATLLENPKYGWIGLQPHPEKVEFEFNRKSFNLPERCVLLSRDVAKAFLNECRKSLNMKGENSDQGDNRHELVDLFQKSKKEILMRDYYAVWMFDRDCDIIKVA